MTSTPLLNSSGGSTPDTYGEGETIEVSVTFNEAVTATTGTDFVLSVGGAKRAPLLRGSGTATLVFGYTVLADDEDTDGIWIGDQDRTLVGDRNSNPQNGTIASVATTVAADLTHDELGTLSGHKVDGSRRVTSTDATLSALVVTYGSSEVPLSPFFAPDTTAYTGSVVNAVTRTYTVTVTRRAVDAPGVEGDLRLTDEEPYTHPDGHEGVAGRVEIFHAERWGTVCSDGFSKENDLQVRPGPGCGRRPNGHLHGN